jgi:hypothetical protein
MLGLYCRYLNSVANPDLEVRFSGRVHNATLYFSAIPNQNPPLFEFVIFFTLNIYIYYIFY